MGPACCHTYAVQSLRAAIHCGITACVGVFWYHAIYYKQGPTPINVWTDHLSLTYTNGAGTKVTLLSGSELATVILLCLPVLLAALLVLCLEMAILKPAGPTGIQSAARKVRELLGYQLAPRRFWQWWCGGLSVGDLLVVTTFLAWTLRTLVQQVNLRFARLDAVGELDIHLPEPRRLLQLKYMGVSLGNTLRPALWLLFLPIPHCSFLTRWTSIPFVAMVRYHRWYGHLAMWIVSLHGSCYYAYWALSHKFWALATDWNGTANVNNLAGSLAWGCGLAVWLTSTNYVRRKYFEVFYRTHLLGFLGFMVFGHLHYAGAWTMFMPGLLVYAIDLVLRAGQALHLSAVSAARVSDGSVLVSLQLPTSKEFTCTGKQDVYLLIPALSRWQWHPFTVHKHERERPEGPGALTLHIKRYNKWTAGLVAEVQAGRPLAVRLMGPLGNPVSERYWEHHSTLVLLGGGIGAVPLLALLRDLVQRKAAGQAGRVERVLFSWASRNGGEFSILDDDILATAREAGWLEIRLATTGKPLAEVAECGLLPAANDVEALPLLPLKPVPLPLPLAGSSACTANRGCRAHSAFNLTTWALPSKLAGGFIEMGVSIAVVVGAVLGIVTASTYRAGSRTLRMDDYWKIGLVYWSCWVAGALGLPFLAIVLPVHLWRYRSAGAARAAPASPASPASPIPTSFGAAAVEEAAPVLAGLEMSAKDLQAGGPARAAEPGSALGFSHGVSVARGRPYSRALLEQVVMGGDYPTAHGVAVLAGGPSCMMHAAQACASALQDRGARVHFYRETFTL